MAAVEENPNSKKEEVYIIGGIGYIHEYDEKHRFRIPNGATVVVVSIDEDNWYTTENEDFNFLDFYEAYFNHLLPRLIDIGKKSSYNDKTLKETLYSSLGDITNIPKDEFIEDTNLDLNIYSAGEECPYMHHSLLLYHDGQIIQDRNGIMKYDKIKDSVTKLHTLTSDEYKDPEFIANLYKNSIFPTTKIAQDRLTELLTHQTNRSKLLLSFSFYENIHHTLEWICDTDGTPKLYYTFVMKRKKPKAYFIQGHGYQTLDTHFDVPEGCTIIVKEIAGNVGLANDNMHSKLLSLDLHKLQDPQQFKSNIHKHTKSIAIYKAGDKCPDFRYQLINCFKRHNFCKVYSGITDVSLLKKYNANINKTFALPGGLTAPFNSKIIKENIIPKYIYSVYPTQKEMHLHIRELYLNRNKLNIYDTLINTPLISISQKDLCNRFPGVYYHFICRTLHENVSEKLRKNPRFFTSNNRLRGRKDEHGLRSTPNNLFYASILRPLKPANNFISTVLQHRVGEAATLRAGLERNVYNHPIIKNTTNEYVRTNTGKWTQKPKNVYRSELQEKIRALLEEYEDLMANGINTTKIDKEFKNTKELLRIAEMSGGNTRKRTKIRHSKRTRRHNHLR